MSEGHISIKKAIPIIVVTWILSLITTLAIVYFTPFVPIGTNQIADDAIITTKLANGSITSAKILDGTIIAQDMADGSIIAIKVGDGAVTTVKIADGAVVTEKIADGAVVSIKLVDGSVTSAKILDGAVTAVDLANGCIITAKIADGSITTAKIGDGAVTNMKLAADAIPFATISRSTTTTTSSLTFSDMQDTNTTITLERTSHLLIILTMEGTINPASIQMLVRALVETQGALPYSYYLVPSSTAFDTWTTTFYKSSVTPGTYNVKIVWSVNGGTATAQKRVLTVIALPA